MKIPEPVAEVSFHHARNQSNEITVDLPCGTKLYSEAQLREALAQQEAVMRQALEALKAMQSYAAAENKGLLICDDAIKALEESLK